MVGGTLGIVSRPGQGTTVRVTPLANPQRCSAQPPLVGRAATRMMGPMAGDARRAGSVGWPVVALTLFVSVTPLPAEGPSVLGVDNVREIFNAASQGLWSERLRPKDEAQQAAYERWLERNRESLQDTVPLPELLPSQPWGICTLRAGKLKEPARLYLHVFDWHTSGKIVVYGLTGDVKNAYLLADPSRTKLKVAKAESERWVTVLGPKQGLDPLATVVVLELKPVAPDSGGFGAPVLPVDRVAVSPVGEGTVPLFARQAIVYGKTLRYEPEPNKDTIGYWTDASDWVKWEFEVAKPGEYEVTIRYGCGKGSGGSTVEFKSSGETLPFTVKETGGFQNWVDQKIGTLRLSPGPPGASATLEVRVTKKPGVAVMDLQQVTLTLAGGGKR